MAPPPLQSTIEDVDFFTAHADNRLSLMPLILQGHLVGIFWLVRNVVGMFFFFGGMSYRYTKVNSGNLF